MILKPETGEGLADANSYVTREYADLYFDDRGLTDWADATVEEREAALVRATFAIDTKYAGMWYGQKITAVQRLSWPRALKFGSDAPIIDAEGVPLPVDAVPRSVQDATCEVALIELTERFLTTSVSRDQYVKREKIDVIETEWSAKAPVGILYPHVESLLSTLCYTGPNGGAIRITLGLTEAELNQHTEDDLGYLSDPRYFEVS